MQVICTDGTMFTCEGYELTEYGAALFGERHDPEGERYDSDPAQIGYVPHERLWYILPDGVEPNITGLSATRVYSGQRPASDTRETTVEQPRSATQQPQPVSNQVRQPSVQSRERGERNSAAGRRPTTRR